MILMVFLFAPTVPSQPRPQNLQLIVPSVGQKRRAHGQGQVRHVVVDADGEVILRLVEQEVVEHRHDLGGSVSLLERP